MTEDLKPCPFCGGEADNRHQNGIIECRSSDCNVCVYTSGSDFTGTDEERNDLAAEAWNTRASDGCDE